MEKTHGSNQSTPSEIQHAPAISPLTHLSKFYNLLRLFVIAVAARPGSQYQHLTVARMPGGRVGESRGGGGGGRKKSGKFLLHLTTLAAVIWV